MTVLEKILETTVSSPSNTNRLRAERVCSIGRSSALVGLGLALLAPLLLPFAVGIEALRHLARADRNGPAQGRQCSAQGGGGGGNRRLDAVGSDLPPKIFQKIFGALPRWRFF